MSSISTSIQVICPTEECKKSAKIEVPNYLLNAKKYGTLKIQVHVGACCEHEFITFIDRTGKVRGYEKIDMSISLNKFLEEQERDKEKIYISDLLKQYGGYAVYNIIRAIMLDLKVYLILNKDQSIKYPMMVNTLLKSFLPDNLKKELIVFSLKEEEYAGTEIKSALAISPSGTIAECPWKEGTYENEREIVNKGMYILDREGQSVIVEDELRKLYERSLYVLEVIEGVDQIYEDELKTKVKERFSLNQCSDEDIMFLKQVCTYRLKGPTDRIKIRSFSKLKEGLW